MERIQIVKHVIGGKIRLLLVIPLSSYRTNPNAQPANHAVQSDLQTPGNYSGQRHLPFQARVDCLRPLPILERPTGAMSMNIFRLCGDMSHVFSIIVLLLRLRVAKNASGELRGHIRRFVFCVCVSCVCSFILADVCRKTGPQNHTVEMRCASLDGGEVSMWVSFFPAAAERSHASVIVMNVDFRP